MGSNCPGSGARRRATLERAPRPVTCQDPGPAVIRAPGRVRPIAAAWRHAVARMTRRTANLCSHRGREPLPALRVGRSSPNRGSSIPWALRVSFAVRETADGARGSDGHPDEARTGWCANETAASNEVRPEPGGYLARPRGVLERRRRGAGRGGAAPRHPGIRRRASSHTT